ncbi:12553_t:CDS:2 [Racocetra fulgida]|uniref:12553_t:CDS:1 n=1 Tax=Racocetra fulgida TaxID=60492 RepID=A0A9N9N860_9GLOM|nr:12553_t:CDS:2 [Racocetra fulgida]
MSIESFQKMVEIHAKLSELANYLTNKPIVQLTHMIEKMLLDSAKKSFKDKPKNGNYKNDG